MLNNSTNINKRNNHLSPKTTEHTKRTMTYFIGYPSPGIDRHKNVAGLNMFMFTSMIHMTESNLILKSHLSLAPLTDMSLSVRSKKTLLQVKCG